MLSAISHAGLSANRLIAAFAGVRASRATTPNRVAPEQTIGRIEGGPVGKSELTEEERVEVRKLEQRDAEVRRHEQTHKSAAGQHASGGPTFEYQEGPDGRQYAVGGEVRIDTSPVEGDPEATIKQMEQIRRAALAPAEPSAQDRQVAAQAASAANRARAELAREKAGETGDPPDAESDRHHTDADRKHAASIAAQEPARPGQFIDVAA